MTFTIFARQRRAATSLLALTLSIPLAAACTGGTSETATAPATANVAAKANSVADPHASHGSASNRPLTPEANRGVAEVRAATARFHDIKVAQQAGYVEQWPAGCITSPAGAQAFHYRNTALASDGTVDLTRPELLMYEPGPNGTLKLIGVDYYIPFAKWAGPGVPSLLGQDFAANDALQAFTLHIWAWAENPSGMFAGWNPKVSCANATP